MTIACRRALVALVLACCSSHAIAQSNLGPVTRPIQLEPQLGLPEKAAPPSNAVGDAVAAPRGGTPAPAAATAEEIWQSECQGEGAARICQALVRGTSGGQIVMVLSLAKPAGASGVAMQMALPLGFSIERGVGVTLGDFKSTYTVARCTAQGCLVENSDVGPLAEAIAKAEGESPAPTAIVTITTMEGGAVNLPIPLKGAKAAFAAAGLVATQ